MSDDQSEIHVSETVEAASQEAEVSKGRRKFLRTTGLSAFGAMLGMTIPFEKICPMVWCPSRWLRIPDRT